MKWRKHVWLAGSIPLGVLMFGCETYHDHVVVEHRAEPDVAVAQPAAARYDEAVIVDPPPAPIQEVVPAAPDSSVIWINGYYRHDGRHYVWVGGHYERPPHGGAHWSSGHWDHERGGYVWRAGHWD